MEFIADESVDFGIIKRLRLDGIDIFSIAEQKSGISDREVLKLANQKNLVLITEDKDFGVLTFRFKLKHAGILLIRLNDIPRQERIDFACEIISSLGKELKNKFSVLNKTGLRLKPVDKEY